MQISVTLCHPPPVLRARSLAPNTEVVGIGFLSTSRAMFAGEIYSLGIIAGCHLIRHLNFFVIVSAIKCYFERRPTFIATVGSLNNMIASGPARSMYVRILCFAFWTFFGHLQFLIRAFAVS